MYLDAPRTRSTRVSFDLVPSSTEFNRLCGNENDHQKKKNYRYLKKKNTVRTLPRLLHVDRLSSLSHCRGPSGPPKCSLCRLHRQLRTGRLIIVTSFLSGLEFASHAPIAWSRVRQVPAQFPEDRNREVTALHRVRASRNPILLSPSFSHCFSIRHCTNDGSYTRHDISVQRR